MAEEAKASAPPSKPPTSDKNKASGKGDEATNGEKKERAPRQDYGFAPTAKITVVETEKKYRGQRGEWYDLLKAANGKTVEQFAESAKKMKDPARGWLRFFVQDGACTLTAPPEAPKPDAK
jgi:hypothetical protein